MGVLIVSGLSEPQRGGALIRAADALRGCLDRWVTRDDDAGRTRQRQLAKAKAAAKANGPEAATREAEVAALEATPPSRPAVGVRDVTLKSESDVPAHLMLAVGPGGASSPVCVDEWCLAESWWAGDFQPPGVPVLTRWVLKVAPIIILKHFAQGLRHRWRGRPRRLLWCCRLSAAFVRFCLAPALSVLAIAGSLVLVLLASLPVPKLSAAIRGSTARLAARIGDSYVLLESPTRFGAVLRRVERDLAWLEQRCERVAVVAEGQGAIVAHRCLQGRGGAGVALFVSVGSGLRKVAELEEMARTRSGVWIGWAVSVLTVLLVIGVAAPLAAGGEDLLGLAVVAAFYVGLFLVIIIANVVTASGEDEPRIEAALELVAGGAGPRWVDFFASADPVPNGPVFERAPDWIEPREVWSTASTLADHRSYWRNPDGFVLPLGRLLVDAADAPEVASTLALDPETVRAATRRRAWRVGWLVVARGCIAAATLFAGVRMWGDLERAGLWIAEHAPEWVKSAITALFSPLQGLLGLLHLETRELLAAALIAAGAAVFFAPVRIVWSMWDRREVTQTFRREPFGLGGGVAALALVVAAWGCIVLVQAGWAGSWDEYVVWLGARDPLYYGWTLTVGFMTCSSLVTLGLIRAAPRYILWLLARLRGRDDPRPPFEERYNRMLAGGGFGFVLTTSALLLFPRLLGDPELAWPWVYAFVYAALWPLASRVTAGGRAALRRGIINWSTSGPAAAGGLTMPAVKDAVTD